jgi:prepilin-type N-terminal cleavage/methylation domain-containing protein
MKHEQGFSLVELLIVVAIIAIIAAIAVPSLLTSRMAANEASGIQGCRTIGSAEIAYSAGNNQLYADITVLAAQSFLDARFGTAGAIDGYRYAAGAAGPFTNNLPTTFSFRGTPDTNLGRYLYGIGPDQVVRYVGFQAPATAYPPGVSAGDPIGRTT